MTQIETHRRDTSEDSDRRKCTGDKHSVRATKTRSTRTRRAVLKSTAGVATSAFALSAVTPAGAQSSDGSENGGQNVKPDFGGWLEDVDGGYVDARGQEEVIVRVGADGNTGSFAFGPAGLWVDPGTTVVWEWTGKGGGHNVNAQEGADFTSGDPITDAGHTFEWTFDEGGQITTYQCDPHEALGMKGAVAVGDVPTVPIGGGAEPTGWTPPGGDLGLAFMLLVVGTAGITATSILAGEIVGSARRRITGEQTSAYTAAIGAGIVGLVFLVAVVVKLLTGA